LLFVSEVGKINVRDVRKRNEPACDEIFRCDLKLSFSPQSTLHFEYFGNERQPIAIIDNALLHPHALIEDACSKPFSRIGPYYPGLRAHTGEEFTQTLIMAVGDILAQHFNVAGECCDSECFYSVVTTPPDMLAPIQRFPHYDGVEENRIAILCYLGKPEQGGTAFYRHRSTGYETVNTERFSTFKQALEAEVREHGLPPPQYIEDGTPIFERIGVIESIFNRILIYRGFNLHCSVIDNASPLPSDPREGRLTVNCFLRPKPRAEITLMETAH
jgi:Family of unknown function (DUF6445)